MQLNTKKVWLRLFLLLLHILASQQTRVLQIAQIANEFGFKLAKKLGTMDDNYIISPLNIFTAMCMIYLGVTGDLEKELNDQLKQIYPDQDDRFEYDSIHLNLKTLLSKVQSERAPNNLSLAHGWFLQKDLQLGKTFQERLRYFYPNSTISSVDFSSNSSRTVRVINDWVSRLTQNRVKYLLSMPPDPVPQVALFNVAYFKGRWRTKFPVRDKKLSKFYKTNNQTSVIRYMCLKDQEVKYYEDQMTGYRFLSLPYFGDTIDFLLGLPPENVAADLTMTQQLFSSIQQNFETRRIKELRLPKFIVEYAKDMSGPFKRLFIKLFGTSGFLSCNDTDVDVRSFPFWHRAVVEVDDKGVYDPLINNAHDDELTNDEYEENVIVANHPFLFYITENKYSTVLFCGRFAAP